jgi:plasmid stability protein
MEKPPLKKFSIVVEPETIAWLKTRAQRRGWSTAAEARAVIHEKMRRDSALRAGAS